MVKEKTLEIKRIGGVGTVVTKESSEMYIETDKGRISTNDIKKITVIDR